MIESSFVKEPTFFKRSITSIGKHIKSKHDLIALITTASREANSYASPNLITGGRRESQRKFLKGIIKRYKIYFLSGYTMKFISLLTTNIENRKPILKIGDHLV